MGIRHDLPRIPTSEKPSFFNLDTALGFFVGSFVGNLILTGTAMAVIGTALVTASPAVIMASLPWILGAGAIGIGVTIAGTVMGASQGKKRMEDELAHGRVVNEPTYLNKGTILGIVLGDLAITVASIALPVLAPLGLVVAVAGGVAGSIWRKEEMQQDVATAEKILAQSHGQPARSQSREHAVSHAEAQQLEARMKQGNGHTNFAEQVTQSREHASHQHV